MQQMSNILVETVFATTDLMRTVLPSVYLGLFLANLSTCDNFTEKGRFWVPIVMKVTGLSAASAISIILSIGDRTAGMAALGGAFREGDIPPAMVVPLLLSTSLLHNFYDLFASSIPRTAAIFGRRLGVKVALWSFGITQAVMLAAILLTL